MPVAIDPDRVAELRSEEGWSSWTTSRYRRLSRPTSATWSGLRDIMGAAAWVAGWALGIALAVGTAILLAVALFHWIVD